ncbi:hypothetical protein V1508DRAFT_402914 [Lipomyces doorenjongii]|uniref:uncharacterized protein n=1 Tax=Lipomyces doorenjongii TaxID=383834 RepID=UPI0034CFEA96
MATFALSSTKAGSSLESLRMAALQSRAKPRVPSLSKAAASAFEQDSEDPDEELARRIRSERTPSPDGQANESFDSISTSLSSILEPKVQADAVAALSDLSRAGLSYQDLLTYGGINAQFLSMLVSSVSLPSSSPTTETSKRADTSMSSPAQKSDVFIDDRDIQGGGEKALAELSSAGLSCNDMVQLGGLHPLFLAQLISQMSSSLQNHAQLLEQAMAIVQEAAATLSAAPSSMPSSGAATPTHSMSATPVTASAQNLAPLRSAKTEASTNGKLEARASAIASDSQQPVIATPSTGKNLRNRIVSNGQSSVSISGNSVNVSRTLRRRPTAMDLDATSNQNVKFGSDRSNGKMVIEMSDSDESDAEGGKK